MTETAAIVDMRTGEIVEELPIEAANVRSKPPVPTFEGHTVEGVRMKIAGQVTVMSTDVVSVDDRLRIVGEFRVSGVRHYVDDKTGDLIREQIIRPIDGTVELTPWDAEDENDNGIVRAR
jgi:hypothetical protein